VQVAYFAANKANGFPQQLFKISWTLTPNADTVVQVCRREMMMMMMTMMMMSCLAIADDYLKKTTTFRLTGFPPKTYHDSRDPKAIDKDYNRLLDKPMICTDLRRWCCPTSPRR
jgi:hypothetical protein